MVQYSGINPVFDNSQKDLRTMKSSRLAVFTASAVHLRGESRVEGNPQVSDVGDLGNNVVGICRGERPRKRREIPNSEASTFFGVDW